MEIIRGILLICGCWSVASTGAVAAWVFWKHTRPNRLPPDWAETTDHHLYRDENGNLYWQ